MNTQDISRRSFLKGSTGAAAVIMAAPMILTEAAKGANDRIRIAVLGVNGRGKDHIRGFMGLENVEVVTLCDPDKVVLEKRQQEFKETYSKKVKIEQDLRKVYDDKNIDAVSIASTNHWHALSTIWACQAGKDVYVEKPGSHNIWEGRKMVEAATKYNRIVQHGVQLRSSAAIREAIQHLRDGIIGDVYMARGLVFRWRPDIGDNGFEPIPDGLDYDLWLGPAAERPFTRNLVHYNWHWHWDFGNGDVGNQGIHETDLCMWGLNVGLPSKITSMGGKFLWDDCKETPEVQTSLYYYPEERKMIQFEVRHWNTNYEDGVKVGNIFYGKDGYMLIKGYSQYETFLSVGKEKYEPGPSGTMGGDHYANFIEAVRARDKSILNGPVETAHLSSALAHLGNIAYRLDRVLEFDPSQERFVDDDDANKMLRRKYREPYVVPKVV
ncbi:Gfo/Idh/MocA family oxidoreductase [candidate division KSB1 bacterium]|nr:Gfo/Idh/MocA family oxidoreductase [candidate division KSB1 bacterium]